MAGLHRRAADVGRPRLPCFERRCRGRSDAAAATATNQRKRYFFTRLSIRLVVLEIGVGASPIVLADRTNALRITQRAEIVIHRARIETAREGSTQKIIQTFGDQIFRHRMGLREKRRVENAACGYPVQTGPIVVGRQDVQDRYLRQTLRMIKRKTISDATASVMANNAETFMAKSCHHFNHDPSHRALGVGRVVGIGLWHLRETVSRQISNDELEVLRQLRRHKVPHHMCLWISVQQQERRSFAADASEYATAARVNPLRCEARKEISEMRHYLFLTLVRCCKALALRPIF